VTALPAALCDEHFTGFMRQFSGHFTFAAWKKSFTQISTCHFSTPYLVDRCDIEGAPGDRGEKREVGCLLGPDPRRPRRTMFVLPSAKDAMMTETIDNFTRSNGTSQCNLRDINLLGHDHYGTCRGCWNAQGHGRVTRCDLIARIAELQIAFGIFASCKQENAIGGVKGHGQFAVA